MRVGEIDINQKIKLCNQICWKQGKNKKRDRVKIEGGIMRELSANRREKEREEYWRREYENNQKWIEEEEVKEEGKSMREEEIRVETFVKKENGALERTHIFQVQWNSHILFILYFIFHFNLPHFQVEPIAEKLSKKNPEIIYM